MAVRLRQLEREFGADLHVEWRSYLLRPRPSQGRDLDKFRAYTRGWLRVGSDEDAPEFRVWEGDAGPPSHSFPPHQVAKAAARLGVAAFDAIHDRLLRAYFSESLDVTDTDTLLALWREVGLPDEGFAAREDPAFVQQIIDEHNESIQIGVTGVPAVRLAENEIAIVGAQPIETYRRWIQRQLAARRDAVAPSTA